MSQEAPDPPLQNPTRGTSIDTSARSLGLEQSTDEPNSSRTSIPGAPRTKVVMKRVEETAAKLGTTLLGTSSKSKRDNNIPQQQQQQNQSDGRLSASLPSAAPHRFLSLSRKGKGKARETSGESTDRTPGSPPRSSLSRSTSSVRRETNGADDSPFIRPRSPSPPRTPPKRPSLEALKGLGSIRAGTQALIQAIQAIPWTDEPDNDDDAIPPVSVNSDSSEEDQANPPLASSIHTIYRPIARSRKHDPSMTAGKGKNVGYFSPVPSSDEEDGNVSDEDDDFEATPIEPRMTGSPTEMSLWNHQTSTSPASLSEKKDGHSQLRRGQMMRSSSLATVRVKRRTMLAEKLKDVFGLNEIREVVAELPCWLLRSVLLQGYMYLTNSHLCFFAHLPAREDQVLKSGSLNKKTQRTKRWVKHWFVLKNDVLSWYQSSSDPYFPHGVIDLRYAISCEPVQEKGFRIRTNQKVVNIMADSIPSREEWVKAVRKVIFKAQNVGESVQIAIPYSVIVDVDRSTAMDFSETIEVKVLDQEDKETVNSYDSYFFAYFHNMAAALDQIRDAVKTYKPTLPATLGVSETVHDTTYAAASADRTGLLVTEENNRSGYGLKLASLFRPFTADTGPPVATSTQNTSQSRSQSQGSTFSGSSSASVPNTLSPRSGQATPTGLAEFVGTSRSQPGTPAMGSLKSIDFAHTYPPPPSPPSELSPIPSRESSASTSSWAVPTWLRSSRRVFASPSAISSGATIGQKGVSEVVSDASFLGDRGAADLGYSVLETRNAAEPEVVEKFRTTFAFDEREQLLGYFQGYLFRLLPTYGRLYVSSNFFCFKSSGPLATRTRMQLPIRDILSLERTKAYRFGQVGLVVIIKGHEELFFEFGSADRRDAFISLLERQMEDVQRRTTSGENQSLDSTSRHVLLADELGPASLFGDEDMKVPSDSTTEDLPAVMFTSTSSTFLTFKPRQPLHFTCLTIGSRGDVQPYISLAKGLMADGHMVRIATHGEFKEWVESHGIEFGYVGGDPAELMRICVENGMFTVSFLKEGIQKFRGWLDDLLKTSWEACQGTDVLIESPSAMSGIHIAEALRIPYYRAFTMTWTRTRAYPHAFAVPEHKMGGGYNYMSYVMFDQVFWRAIAGQINRWRRETLKLSGTNLDKLEPHKVPFLYNFSPTVVPPPLDWPEWIRITGYWFLDDADVSAEKWSPPEDLVEFIDSAHQMGKKVVYIGFGSIVVSDPDAMTRCVVEAIKRSGVCAILSKGWSDRLQVKKGTDVSDPEMPLPPQIYPIKSIPHDWLFKRIEAACHHGGAGTTGASLRAGIPTIIKPFFGDQFFWGDRVEALGTGSCVRKLTVDSLADALIAATTDEKQIAKAKLVGERIRAENGVATAIESIYRDLEYARSLIKTSRAESENDTIREVRRPQSSNLSTAFSSPQSSADSYVEAQEAPSEDWSVISDSDEKRSSRHSTDMRTQSTASKRSSLAAAVFSVLPEVLQPNSPKSNSRI
ncbi:ATG26 [Sanghuangporus vaninii]